MTNGRWIFRQIWYILGECQQFDSPCIDQYRLFVLVSRPILCFSGQGNFFLREWPISSVKTDCRTTLNHCPSISKQFVMSVVCRSTLRHLEFSQLGVGRLAPIDDWKSTESRLVYRAILTNRLRKIDLILITLDKCCLSSLSVVKADDAIHQTFLVNK